MRNINPKRIFGGVLLSGVFIGLVQKFLPELAKELFYGSLGDWLRTVMPAYIPTLFAEYLAYSPAALLCVVGVMGVTGLGENIHVRSQPPFFYSIKKKPEAPDYLAIADELQQVISIGNTLLMRQHSSPYDLPYVWLKQYVEWYLKAHRVLNKLRDPSEKAMFKTIAQTPGPELTKAKNQENLNKQIAKLRKIMQRTYQKAQGQNNGNG